ncbi:hypothetical protein COCNU_09G001790 [Cocos nucifera]|uniref:Uncharacterized protein n=1 Tax=Cocos nucifera TaxID=13894 RepID=A0A8K0IJU9_COCNU|nr:hypothetical protein COCNU_09G001790 [Cocos nucifera]
MASLSLPLRPLSQALAVPNSSYRLKTRSFPLRSSRLVSTPRSPKELLFLNFRRMPLLGSRVPNLEENSDFGLEVIQEQVRSGDATATEYFELGAVMLRRKFYPAAVKYLQQAIEKWDRDDQDLAQVYNALGVSHVRDNKLDKGIAQFEKAVKLQPGYVTAWNNLGDAYEKKKDLRSALKAFEEVLLFDPNNKVARPRRDALRDRVKLYKGVPLKSEDR